MTSFNYTCKQCGTNYKVRNPTSNFCSRKCQGEHKTEKAIERRPLSLCSYCGKGFKAKRLRGQKYCSNKCLRSGRSTAVTAEKKCQYCKLTFKTKFLHLVHCSNKCRTKSRRLSSVQSWKAKFGQIETLSKEKLQDVRDS